MPAHYPDWYTLKIDTVKHYGAPIAAVVARDKNAGALEGAAELVTATYENLPYVGGATPKEQAKTEEEVDPIFKG